jgi:hypothetical protein
MVYFLAVEKVFLNKIINERCVEKIKVVGKKKQTNACCSA